MTALLWARFVLLAGVAFVVACYVWTEIKSRD